MTRPIGKTLLLRGAAPIVFLLATSVGMPAVAQDTGGDDDDRQTSRSTGYGNDALGASAERFLGEDGEAIYMTACAGCHQPRGTGAAGAGRYPPLAGNPVLEGSRYPAWIVVNGTGAMPSFADWLDDEQVVAVVEYIQTSFRNDYEPSLTAEAVAELRDVESPGVE